MTTTKYENIEALLREIEEAQLRLREALAPWKDGTTVSVGGVDVTLQQDEEVERHEVLSYDLPFEDEEEEQQ